ncbi:MAG: hypothetical protein DRN66_01270 [Candidatus Nanohalarchaeota archaeon]|nr:MAG: hypothetical protein DRN66_01270 [Candidatus Nanohaloarchaeota archaeon]
MPRPRRCRYIRQRPGITYFKPTGVPMRNLEDSVLSIDEFEAIRLKDLLCHEQGKCAKEMNISQPTFCRLIIAARKKVADAIVFGKAIRIVGGNVHFRKYE